MVSGLGVQAAVNGFMNGYKFVRGIQREDAQDAERRANRKADIQHRNDREAVTDSRMERNFKLQQKTAQSNADWRKQQRLLQQQNAEATAAYRKATLQATKGAVTQKNLEKKQKQIAGWAYHALKDLANAKTPKEKEIISGTIAKGINQLPVFQEIYGVGGDTGRNATGVELLPNGSYSVTIHNEHTGTTGPMTENASADQHDTLFTIDPAQVAFIAGIKEDTKANKPVSLGAGDWLVDPKTGKVIATNTNSKASKALSVTKQEQSSMEQRLIDLGVDKKSAHIVAEDAAIHLKKQIRKNGNVHDTMQGILRVIQDSTKTESGFFGDSKTLDLNKVDFDRGVNTSAKPTKSNLSHLWDSGQKTAGIKPPAKTTKQDVKTQPQKEPAKQNMGINPEAFLQNQSGADAAYKKLAKAKAKLNDYIKTRKSTLSLKADPDVHKLKKEVQRAEAAFKKAQFFANRNKPHFNQSNSISTISG